MKTIAIITARGGSKRIPHKNIKAFNGTPIISYSIEAAIASGIFDTVMVSTDDESIANISKDCGAEVPFFRSEATSNDFATTRDVLMEVLNEYKIRGKEFDYMACLYPTNPFITPKKLKEAFEVLVKNNALEVLPVVKFSYPPQRAFVMDENNRLRYKWTEFINSRSQDLEAFYHDAGQFYFFNVSEYLKKEGRISEDIYPIILPESEVQDIDNEEDWNMAEFKYEYLTRKRDGAL